MKEKLLERIAEHERLDAIVQRAYWEKANGHWKGGAIGCSLRDQADHRALGENPHRLYPSRFGLPVWLAHLEDEIFRGLPPEEAKGWPRAFAEAIPIGADLSGVADEIAIMRLHRTLELTGAWPKDLRFEIACAIEGVIDALKSGDNAQRRAAEVEAEVMARVAQRSQSGLSTSSFQAWRSRRANAAAASAANAAAAAAEAVTTGKKAAPSWASSAARAASAAAGKKAAARSASAAARSASAAAASLRPRRSAFRRSVAAEAWAWTAERNALLSRLRAAPTADRPSLLYTLHGPPIP